jgi:hypothetical protein
MRYLFSLMLFLSTLAFAQIPSFKPDGGFVPDEATAVAMAIAVLKPIYGADHIERERPFTAKLEDGIWHVYGTLPPNTAGGTAEAWIAKDDGRVLRVAHGQ